jgi:hypothetical protein
MLGQNFQLIIDSDATSIEHPIQVSANISLQTIRPPILVDGVGFGIDCEQYIKHCSLFHNLKMLRFNQDLEWEQLQLYRSFKKSTGFQPQGKVICKNGLGLKFVKREVLPAL